MSEPVTFLFTDVEGSTRLWEDAPDRMRPALAQHDALVRAAVAAHHGRVVKMTGDGVHAAFADPLDALGASVQLLEALVEAEEAHGVPLRVRCGLHLGVDEHRDDDFFGTAVNRAARIMSAAHGGQVLVSQAVAERIATRLPADLALRDLGVVRLRDLASPERVFQIVHPRLRRDFPALRSLEATPNNLPQQLTSFIGREHVLEEAGALLARVRLLTLTGAGGIGKTRLSLQLAAELLDDFPDGVWFVELAPVRDDSLVAQAVASVLRVKEEPGQPIAETLAAYGKDRALLLVLDNCEHLLAGCAALVKLLLRAGGAPKVLASSREALHLPGEATLQIPALAAPRDGPTSVRELGQFEAARLFVDRASAIMPAFHIDADNAVAIADICRRLDGIPLALELAAGRVRALTVAEIAARLSQRFALLSSRDATALPRQRTLRALIDWSYDLLSEAERTLFERLAVFAGSWTLEAAEAVGAAGTLQRADVMDVLAELVEKSLVAMDRDGGRYYMLETMREYAQDRLNDTDEWRAARIRHLSYYLALAEKARPELFGPHQAEWLARLDLERENILAAHVAAEDAVELAEQGLRLVSAMKPYWLNRGLPVLGQRVTLEALARPGAQSRGLARCRALFDAGQLGNVMGRYDESGAFLEESLRIAREIHDPARIAVVLLPLALTALWQGQPEVARRYAEEGLALAHKQGDRRELAAALTVVAHVERMNGALDDAQSRYSDALAITRELGDRDSIAVALLNLAFVAVDRNAVQSARGMLLDVLAIVRETGSRPAGQSLIEVALCLAASIGDSTRCARWFGVAEAQIEHTGIRRDAADEAALAPHIRRARAAMGALSFAQVEAAGRSCPYDTAMDEIAGWLLERGAPGP